jgi:hypothetical protein
VRRRSLRHPLRLAGLGVLGLAAVVACSPVVPATTGPTTPSSIAASPGTSPTSPDGSPATAIAVDEGLLDVLPAQIAGIDLVSDPVTAASIASDPELATIATALAVAVAIEPGASLGDDLAVVSVVQLLPGAYDDTWFRSWRDTYDAAACEPAGGVQGNAEAEIAGHVTFIGTCAQGAFTYHVHLEDPDRLVSITSVGKQRLGEQVVAGLGE